MQKSQITQEKHLFVCVNEREEGKCCKKVQGLEVYHELKQWVKDNNLKEKIKITKTGCMGHCNEIGCTIALYPDKIWLDHSKIEDIEKIKRMLLQDT